MSPAQAAQVAGVSRWTIMRAIKSHELQASRDNRNQWRITSSDLSAWMMHTVHPQPDAPKLHTMEVETELREQLAAAVTRANVAEAMLVREREALDEIRADRDAWKQQATALLAAPQKRRSFWPW